MIGRAKNSYDILHLSCSVRCLRYLNTSLPYLPWNAPATQLEPLSSHFQAVNQTDNWAACQSLCTPPAQGCTGPYLYQDTDRPTAVWRLCPPSKSRTGQLGPLKLVDHALELRALQLGLWSMLRCSGRFILPSTTKCWSIAVFQALSPGPFMPVISHSVASALLVMLS